jgi:hypothetical protein
LKESATKGTLFLLPAGSRNAMQFYQISFGLVFAVIISPKKTEAKHLSFINGAGIKTTFFL